MGSDFDKAIRDFANTIKSSSISKTGPYDTVAEVKRVDGNTAWVHIPGGVDETPVQLTTNAKKGDMVQVRVSGGQAWLYGNSTAPPTDDTKAIQAEKKAIVADEHAIDAMDSASIAKQAADSAVEDAAKASSAADRAEEAAEDASRDAASAYNSASQAISQLSVVEDIVGVLDLLATKGNYEHTDDTSRQSDKWYFILKGSGTTEDPYEYEVATNPIFEYSLTEDTSVVQGKPYYTRSGSGTEEDPYEYTLVNNPVDADLGIYYENSGWNYYELTGIHESIQNYVSSHLALVGNSLFLQTSEGQTSTRLELNTQQGMKMYDTNGNVVATYGNNVVIGDPSRFHVQVTSNRLSFFRDSVHEVAYMSGEKLYITQTVVLQQMDVGRPIGEVDTVTGEVGKGQWSWKVHDIDGVNNLYLKWIG